MRTPLLVLVAGCGRVAFDPLGGDAGGSGDGSPPACMAFGPWSAPTPLAALNTGANEWEPALHPDGDVLVFNRENGGNHVAARDGEQFVSPTAPATWSLSEFGPAWAPTGDRLYLTHTVAASTYRIWESTYAGGVFGTPTAVGGMTTTPALSPTVRNDDLEMYFTTQPFNPTIGRATRPDPSSPWTVTGVEAQLTIPGGQSGWPSISRDGLSLYLEGVDPSGLHLYVATRTAVAEPFGAPVLIAELEGLGDIGDPEVSPDGTTLFYAIEGATSSLFDLHFSTRSCL